MTLRPLITLKKRPPAAVAGSPSHPEQRAPRQHQTALPPAKSSAPLLKNRDAEAATNTSAAPGLALPHERDESAAFTAATVDPVMAQAKLDIDAGLVDTDMRATPGLDEALRRKLVPGPGGRPPSFHTKAGRRA